MTPGEIVVSNSGGTVRLFLQDAGTTALTTANLDTGSSFSAGTQYYVYAATSSATASSSTYYISLSSSAPTGPTYYAKLGSFTTDGSGNIVANKVYTTQYGQICADTNGQIPLSIVYDYGTSTSAYTTRNLPSQYIIRGTVTDDSTISNLPFTSSSSYSVVATMQTSGAISQNVKISNKTASGFTVGDGLGNGNTVDWIAIGY